jgi:hypothetical protein
MSHLFINPEYTAIEKQLRALDRQRDHMRAQMADVAMRADLAQVNREFWVAPEVRAERKAALEARIAKRTARRAAEMERSGCYVPPGPWDEDLDNHQEHTVEEEVEGGYKIRIVRTRDLTFNAYAIIPSDHPMVSRDYDSFHDGDIPAPPVPLTYGGRNVEEGRVYGFYYNSTSPLGNTYGRYDSFNYFNTDKTGGYFTFEVMRTNALKLVDYFKSIAHLPPPPPSHDCPKCGEELSDGECEYCGHKPEECEPKPTRRQESSCADLGLCVCGKCM